MSWDKTIDRYSLLVEDKLKTFFAKTLENARRYHPFIAKAYSDFEEFVLRKGKRLVSCSTLLIYKGYTGKVDDYILNVCVGIELYRHCILIHDDLVDRENLRRGGRTLHQALIEKYDNRFGEGTAIFVGNIAYALATNTIMSSGFSEDKVARVLPLLSKGYMEVNESQMLDLLFEYKNVDVDEWHVMASKRAASLFKVAMLMGAILGGASENDLQVLEESAENMGYSFDIQDDIIDTFTQKEQYGRPPCGDIILGKKPLHVIYALNSADKKQSESLRTLLGKKTLVKEDINLIRTAIRASGGLDAAKNHSKNHSEKAKRCIALTSLKSDVKEFFNSLVTYVDESLEWYS